MTPFELLGIEEDAHEDAHEVRCIYLVKRARHRLVFHLIVRGRRRINPWRQSRRVKTEYRRRRR